MSRILNGLAQIINLSTRPSKRFYTGFWDAGSWDPQQPETRDFIGWLVSNPHVSDNLDEASVEKPLTGGGLVELVGKGSVVDPAARVSVNKVDLTQNGKPVGSYAYWVGDEGVKASYRVPTLGDKNWNSAGVLGVAAKSGVTALGFDGYENLENDRIYASGLSRNSMDLPFGNDDSQTLFHDVTPQAITLLTDVRRGGARKDLSLAFELPLESFNQLDEFHAAGEQNNTEFYGELGSAYNKARFYNANQSPELGYVCEIPYNQGIVRGVSWDYMRNYYRLYKKEWEKDTWARSVDGVPTTGFAARGSLPHSYSGTLPHIGDDRSGDDFTYHPSNGSIYSFHFGAQNMVSMNIPRGKIATGGFNERHTVSRSPQLTPAVVRVTLALGLAKRKAKNSSDWSLVVTFDPYITLVNPYNVPITFDSVGMSTALFNPLRVRLEYTDKANRKHSELIWNFLATHYASHGGMTMRLDPSKGPYTLKPGEVRVMAPVKLADAAEIQRWGVNIVGAEFGADGEDSGLYITGGKNIQPKDGTSVKIKVFGRDPGWKKTMAYNISLFHAKDHQGGNLDLFDPKKIPEAFMGQSSYKDALNQPHLTTIRFMGSGVEDQNDFQIQKEMSTSQIPPAGQGANGVAHIGVFDVKMKTTYDDFPSFSMNLRGGAFDSRDYDGLDRSSPQWDVALDKKTVFELGLEADPEGHSYWGEGRKPNTGSTHTVVYEVPRLPLSSLGQLQHVNTGVTGSSGSLQIGNSFPHPGIKDLSEIVTQRPHHTGPFSAGPHSQVIYDMSWASNEAMWDRYFFSGLNWGNASVPSVGVTQGYSTQDEAIAALLEGDRSKTWPLQNPRIDLFTRNLEQKQKDELKDYDKLARYLAVFGGFNVNSTSEAAWRAVFSSLREVDVSYVDKNGTHKTRKVSNAFSRYMLPSQDSGEVFGSFRDLSDDDIENLAEAMVGQVKARGPFMGLADFVNRRLTKSNKDGTDLGAVGALQAAIEVADLNKGKLSRKPNAANLENVTYQVDGNSREISTYAGTSGYLLQGDILSSIGGILSARSDTFVIRAYGAATDTQGRVIAQAWCEATVQRTPSWVEPTEESPTRQRSAYPDSSGTPIVKQWEVNPDFPEMNRKMGRRFEIQSFRWLSSNEV